MTAIAVSGVIGGPLSGWLLKVSEGWHGLAAWQWLFILEAHTDHAVRHCRAFSSGGSPC